MRHKPATKTQSAACRRLRSLIGCTLGGVVLTVSVAWGLDRAQIGGRVEHDTGPRPTAWPAPVPPHWPAAPTGVVKWTCCKGWGRQWLNVQAAEPESNQPIWWVWRGSAGFPVSALGIASFGEWRLGPTGTINEAGLGLWAGWSPTGSPPFTAGERRLPIKPLWGGSILDTVFYAVCLWGLGRGFVILRCRRRKRRGRCANCGYESSGLPTCPECGYASVRPV